MTFKFQVKEEQCYLVQDEEARRWRKPRPQYKKEKVAPTKPKVDSIITMMMKQWEQDKASNGRHQPKKSKESARLRGRKGRNQEHTRQSLTNFIATKENKEGVACEESIVRVFHSRTGRIQDQLSKRRSPALAL
jgi:hypothetical protein